MDVRIISYERRKREVRENCHVLFEVLFTNVPVGIEKIGGYFTGQRQQSSLMLPVLNHEISCIAFQYKTPVTVI
jgi:hypothetical protein